MFKKEPNERAADATVLNARAAVLSVVVATFALSIAIYKDVIKEYLSPKPAEPVVEAAPQPTAEQIARLNLLINTIYTRIQEDDDDLLSEGERYLERLISVGHSFSKAEQKILIEGIEKILAGIQRLLTTGDQFAGHSLGWSEFAREERRIAEKKIKILEGLLSKLRGPNV